MVLLLLPVVSTAIDEKVIVPSQRIGNFMSFETGPEIIFPV
jgi:hypothetical protein